MHAYTCHARGGYVTACARVRLCERLLILATRLQHCIFHEQKEDLATDSNQTHNSRFHTCATEQSHGLVKRARRFHENRLHYRARKIPDAWAPVGSQSLSSTADWYNIMLGCTQAECSFLRYELVASITFPPTQRPKHCTSEYCRPALQQVTNLALLIACPLLSLEVQSDPTASLDDVADLIGGLG